jgi:hypothetical protein
MAQISNATLNNADFFISYSFQDSLNFSFIGCLFSDVKQGSETQAQPGTAYSVIFGLVSEHIPGINENADVLGETKFDAPACLSKRLLHIIELMTGAAEDVRCDSGVKDGKSSDQISRRAINEIVRPGVFRISIAANTDIAAEKVIQSATGAEPAILPHQFAGNIINRLLVYGTTAKGINRKFLRPVKRVIRGCALLGGCCCGGGSSCSILSLGAINRAHNSQGRRCHTFLPFFHKNVPFSLFLRGDFQHEKAPLRTLLACHMPVQIQLYLKWFFSNNVPASKIMPYARRKRAFAFRMNSRGFIQVLLEHRNTPPGTAAGTGRQRKLPDVNVWHS